MNKITNIAQKSPEWWDLKAGKISGTRFGKLISGRENSLVYDLLAEKIEGAQFEVDGYVNEEMQYGIDNEEYAIELYSKKTGITFEKVGAIISDFHPTISMASPDGCSSDNQIAEVKCTMNIAKHLKRLLTKQVDSEHIPQLINYFAQSNDVQKVHFISYCGFLQSLPCFGIVLTRDSVIKQDRKGNDITVQMMVNDGLMELVGISIDLDSAFEGYQKEISF